MGWTCCYKGCLKEWNYMTPTCHECLHRRCPTCGLESDDIVAEQYHIALQPASSAEENYNFNKFHIHRCDHSKCDGKCGQAQPKELSKEITKRRKIDEQRKKEVAIKTGTSKRTLADRVEEPGDDDFVVKSPQKSNTPKRKLADKVEEPGDDDFMVKRKKDSPRKAKKQQRVRFADQ